MAMTPTTELSTDDLADLSGLTERQVRGYCALGVFGNANMAPGSGRPRSFTREDVLIAGALCKLNEVTSWCTPIGGLSRRMVSQVAAALRGAAPLRWLIIRSDGSVRLALQPAPACAAAVVIDLNDMRLP